MDKESFIKRYPLIYHMAEQDTWEMIKRHGLLSTSAILDMFSISGPERVKLERKHRPQKIAVGPNGNAIVLRDQKPMAPNRLQMALLDGITPEEWYQRLNQMVFMWAQESRLIGLLRAREYRNLEHDVLTIDSQGFINAYEKAIWLCPMNSGNTFPVPHKRGNNTFLRIADYPEKKNGTPAKEVVEVVTDYKIPDIANYVIEVRRMQGSTILRKIPL